ncbi:BTB/POZ domain-containing protein SR1IP1-like [Mangifera indica]|uniref:BTB/POZ domain-containing protein SR1IP1-like n=1 Tax=Mangifera indica TaxID=29780 RepID=UPI001CFB7AB4|nr:BTB/POZ domain-containing protein SR1IP1-like [Mangifera indica]
MATKKKELLFTAMKRASEWIFFEEIPSDVTFHVGGTSFSLHISEADLAVIEVSDALGGAEAEAFELGAKFCYGIHFGINTENIALLRCAAQCLEMT